MYHVMRNSMAAERKHALKDGHKGVIWVTQKAGQRSCHHPGVMRNVTDHWVHPAPHPSHSWGTVPLTASSAAVHDSAHVLRGAAGRFGGASPLRGAQIEGPCARVGAATRARTRSRALALGMRGAHAVVVCGQGIDRHLRFLAVAVEKRRRRPCAIHRLDLAARVSAGRGRRGVASTSICRADGDPWQLRPEATR